MRRVNLLREIENIRNAVTPDTRPPQPRKGGSRRSFALLLILLAAGIAYAVLEMGITVAPGPAYHELAAAVEGLTRGRSADTPAPPAAPTMEQEVAALVEQTALPAPDEKSVVAPAPAQSSPASVTEPEPAPETSAPATQKPRSAPPAQEAPVKPAPAAAAKTAPMAKTGPVSAPAVKHETAPVERAGIESGGGWRLRFGVCMLKQSCEGIVSRLNGMGVLAAMERGSAEMTTHRLDVGPWPARAQAEAAQTALAAMDINVSLHPAASGYHGRAGPFATAALAEQAATMARERGYPANAVKARGVVEVYKVYGERFESHAEAARACEGLGRGGVDCFAEEAR